MWKIQYFTIVLQKQCPVYFSGETMFGSINLKVTEKLKINSVRCFVDGGSHVQW